MSPMKPVTRAVRRALLTALAGAASLGVQAQEQSEASGDELSTIVVTGSRIQRADLEAGSPVTVITNDQLKMAGTTNAEEFLRDMPQLVPAVGGNTNNGNEGAATLDLRNLAEERTLVLVNGKRFVPYDSNGYVDLNMIPAALIERVEIVTGGASAVYGSDAIAGVVNFILRDDFEGLETGVFFGQTEKGDGTRKGFDLTLGVGLDDGKGHLVFNAGYVEQDAVTMGQRDWSSSVLSSSTLSAGSGSGTNAGGTVQGIPAGGGQPAGNYTWDASGNLVPYVGATHGFNFNPYNLLQAPQKQWTATILGDYSVSENVEFFSRFSFANSRVNTIIAPSGTFFFPFEINYATNPFLNAQSRAVLARADDDGDGLVNLAFGRRTVELGTRDSIYENTAYQGVAGLRGNFGESSWNWEGFLQKGRTARTQRFINDINVNRVQQALLAVTDASGNIVCSDDSDGCVPANLFGPGNLSVEAGQFIRLDLQQNDTTDQLVGGGFVSGDLPFTIPTAGAPGAVVFGLEYREEEGRARPDANYAAGAAPGFGQSQPLTARIKIQEAYSELKLPLITDKTAFESLSIEAGIRRSKYENAVPDLQAENEFDTTAWKAGLEWAPIADLRLRAMFQKAVRAPNLNEIGDPRTNGTGDATLDYCSSSNFTPAEVADPGNAALRALCIATGASLARLQAGTVPDPISSQINNYSGGNPDLVPESSETVTIGFVLQPEALEKFTLSVDYFDIKVDKAILQTPEQAILDACFQESQNPGLSTSNFFCSLIHRNPLSGGLNGGLDTGVDASDRNIGFLQSRGIDVLANYSFGLGAWGDLGLNVNLTRQLKTDLRFTDTGPLYECAGLVGNICLRPDPKIRWVQTTHWTRGPLGAQIRWRHLDSVRQDSVARGEAPASDYAVPEIPAFDYFDLGVSYDFEKLTLRFGAENIFNKRAPVVGNDYGGTTENGGNTFPATYDVLGRSYFLSAVAKF